GDVAQGAGGFPELVEELDRILDAVLHHPLHLDHVEIAGEHKGFRLQIFGRVGAGATLASAAGTEAELLLEHPFGGNALDLVHAEGELEVQSRVGDVDHRAEALDHGALLGLDGVEARERRPAEDENQQDGDEAELALAAASAATAGATTTAAAS